MLTLSKKSLHAMESKAWANVRADYPDALRIVQYYNTLIITYKLAEFTREFSDFLPLD